MKQICEDEHGRRIGISKRNGLYGLYREVSGHIWRIYGLPETPNWETMMTRAWIYALQQGWATPCHVCGRIVTVLDTACPACGECFI